MVVVTLSFGVDAVMKNGESGVGFAIKSQIV